MIRLLGIAILVGLALPLLTGADGDEEWNKFRILSQPIPVPGEWMSKAPTEDQIRKHNERNAIRAGEAAVKAKEFYTRFPSHPKSADARNWELLLLQFAVQGGATNHLAALDNLETSLLRDPKITPADRFEIRLKQMKRSASRAAGGNLEKLFLEHEKGVRMLNHEFPQNAQVYQFMLELANRMEHDKAAPLAREVLQNSKSPMLREAAQSILNHTQLVGKPLNIKFVAFDGSKVDLTQMKGKVVLLDFWATSCPPCVEETPHLRQLYQEMKPKGFEIVGINMDEDKSTLRKFITKEKVTWPQYFDGLGRDNKIAEAYQIGPLPTMWLVDKKGNLRYLKGNYGLKEKIQALLEEKS